MLIENGTIKILGDPHIAKVFTNNVPLHRRGEREKMVWLQFERGLHPEGADCHVMTGDLFDRAIVQYEALMRAASLYRVAASSYPNTTFVVMRGNHDASRDL